MLSVFATNAIVLGNPSGDEIVFPLICYFFVLLCSRYHATGFFFCFPCSLPCVARYHAMFIGCCCQAPSAASDALSAGALRISHVDLASFFFRTLCRFGFAQKIWLIFAVFVRIIILFVFVQSYHPIGSQFLIKLPRYSLFCDQCEPCGYHPLGYQSSNDKSGSDIPSPLNQSAVVQHQLGQNVHVQHQVPPRDTVVPAGVGSQQFQQPWLTIRTRAVLAA